MWLHPSCRDADSAALTALCPRADLLLLPRHTRSRPPETHICITLRPGLWLAPPSLTAIISFQWHAAPPCPCPPRPSCPRSRCQTCACPRPPHWSAPCHPSSTGRPSSPATGMRTSERAGLTRSPGPRRLPSSDSGRARDATCGRARDATCGRARDATCGKARDATCGISQVAALATVIPSTTLPPPASHPARAPGTF